MGEEDIEMDIDIDVKVGEYIRETVGDWEDEMKSRARFKAFSGQRSDWDPQYCFWRDLILRIARRFNLLFVDPSTMKNSWFNRAGLSPLCLDHVLMEMYKDGDLLRMTDVGHSTSSRLFQFVKNMIPFSNPFTSSTSSTHDDDRLLLSTMLEDKASAVVKSLSESHWTSSCILTMTKFVSLFGERAEAYAVLNYLSGHGRAKQFSIRKKLPIEGVKLSLSSAATSSVSSVDFDLLQLVWTVEELQLQLDVIDKQYERSRESALAAMKSGDKKKALRHARQLKLASEYREKVSSLLNRVEGVLLLVLDAESTKKVSEAIQVGARAIKENQINVEEVQLCLQELDELKSSQEEVKKALEIYAAEDDEDLEEELEKLESQIRDENILVSNPSTSADEASASTNSLSFGIAHLTLEEETQKPLYEGSKNPTNLALCG